MVSFKSSIYSKEWLDIVFANRNKAYGAYQLRLFSGKATTVALLIVVCVALGLWGIANTALYPICQVRVMRSVSHAQALAGTTNVSAANAGIGVGAIVGGMTLAELGIGYLGYMAAAVALLALLLALAVRKLAPER